MQGFTPQHRKKESIQGSANKPAPQIAPKKAPGAQAQAMNQQPDSVPAMVKPGEYVLPADTVDAVGGPQALDGVVQATHMPAPNTAVVPQGFEPQYFFANGGAVPDEENRRLVQVPQSMQRRENTTFAPDNSINETPAAPQVPAAPAVSTASTAAPAQKPAAPPAAETAQQPVQAPAAVGFTPGAAPKPSAPAKPAPVSPTALFVSEASADAGKRWDQGDLAGAAGAALRTGAGAITLGAVEALDNTVGAAARGFWDGGGRMLNGLMGTPAQAAAVPPPAAPAVSTAKPATASAPAQQTPAANTPAAPAAAAVKPAATSQQAAGPVPASTTAANPTQLPAGVYQHGRGQYSDSADGMGFPSGFTGRPSEADQQRAAAVAQANSPMAAYAQKAQGINNQPSAAAAKTPAIAGLLEGGNIDLTKRPVVKNADGSISTVRSTSVNFDGKEYLIPTVSDDGRIMSEEEAVQQFKASGKHLGVFSNPQDATAYAKELSANQARMYGAATTTGQPASAPQARSPVGMNVQAAQAAGLVGERIGYNPAYDQRLNGWGQPSTQNMAAGFRAPTVAHSGNDFAARKRLENMATAASSITNTERWGGKGASRNPAVQAYEAAVKADLQAQGLQPDVDTKVMGFNANLMREQMNQDGATQRAVMQEAGADRRDSRRAGLESRKLGMEETAQGFQTRQAQRIEGLYQQYDAAKTDQERAAIAAQIRTYQGKEAPAEWGVHVTPTIKNADGSTSEGSVYRYNKRTGQVEAVAGNSSASGPATPRTKAEYDALPKGAQYMRDGKTFIKS